MLFFNFITVVYDINTIICNITYDRYFFLSRFEFIDKFLSVLEGSSVLELNGKSISEEKKQKYLKCFLTLSKEEKESFFGHDIPDFCCFRVRHVGSGGNENNSSLFSIVCS